MTAPRVLVVLAALFALPRCSCTAPDRPTEGEGDGGEGEGEGGEGEGEPAAADFSGCDVDDDCESGRCGEVGVGGLLGTDGKRCVPDGVAAACVDARDCAADLRCQPVSGSCTAAACGVDDDCAAFEVCVDGGFCGALCAAPAGVGEACVAFEEGLDCEVTRPCAPQLECVVTQGVSFRSGVCAAPQGPGGVCGFAAHLDVERDGCAAGLVCEGTTGTCVTPCDAGCTADEVCSAIDDFAAEIACPGCVAPAREGEVCAVVGTGADFETCFGTSRPCVAPLSCAQRGVGNERDLLLCARQ